MERITKPLPDHLTPINVKETQIYNYINRILSNPSEYTELNRMFAEKAIEWQKDYDLSDSDFQDYMDSAFDSYIESVRDRSFDEGFWDGYEAGEKDSDKHFFNFQKRVAHMLVQSGKFTDDYVMEILRCEPELIEELKKET